MHSASLLALLLLPAAVPPKNIDATAIDKVVQNALKTWDVPGAAVVIVRGERVVYLKGFGVRELGGKELVTPDTVFPLSSCSKAFTTLALAMLADEGKLRWDDPVRKHLDYFRLADPLADANVTLRDLVCHRTGLAGHDLLWYRAPWGLEEQIRRVGRVPLTHSFRSALQYQNIMVGAAGLAAAHASGGTWDAFVQKRILDPLGMKATKLTTPAALKAADHSSGHRWGGDGRQAVVPWYMFATPHPAMSVYTTARDLGPWLRFHLGDGTWDGKRLVSAENLSETHLGQMLVPMKGLAKQENPFTTQLSYAMGWVVQDYRGHKLVSHAGNIDGIRAHITLAPDDGIGLAVLANLQDTRMNLALSNTLLDHLLGLPKHDWDTLYTDLMRDQRLAAQARYRERLAKRQEGTKPSLQAKEYVGTYEHPAYGTAKIVLEKDALVWQWSSFRSPLEHWHFDTFTVANEGLGYPPLQFLLNGDGEVRALRVLDQEFKQIKKD